MIVRAAGMGFVAVRADGAIPPIATLCQRAPPVHEVTGDHAARSPPLPLRDKTEIRCAQGANCSPGVHKERLQTGLCDRLLCTRGNQNTPCARLGLSGDGRR